MQISTRVLLKAMINNAFKGFRQKHANRALTVILEHLLEGKLYMIDAGFPFMLIILFKQKSTLAESNIIFANAYIYT